jgi:glycosyltransferase involved in cell wall biosynthesis
VRILHVPYSFYPDPSGGTEVYVDGLAACQHAMGLEAAVAAPANPGAGSSRYDHNGTPVWRFEITRNLSLPALYGEGDPRAADAFGAILDEYQPDILHLHALTSAVSVLLLAQAKRRGYPIIFNFHTPTASCARGTLRLFGEEVCDGKLYRHRCTACNLQAHGTPRALANAISYEPAFVRQGLQATGLERGIWTAFRMPELIDIRIGAFASFMGMSDRVVALCNWTRELLLRNGIPESKMALCRQGISWLPQEFPPLSSCPASTTPLRTIFLGRMDETKGPHLLVEALRRNPKLPLTIDLFGVRQGQSGNSYAEKLRAMIGDDSRIRLLPPVSSSEVIARIQEYDAILVPSQWLETGPLVVLEAFAARTPVIGSDLGGIAELVTDGLNGFLVSPYNSAEAWGTALRRICDQPSLLDALRAGIQPPRHTRDAARELMPVYEGLVKEAIVKREAVTR